MVPTLLPPHRTLITILISRVEFSGVIFPHLNEIVPETPHQKQFQQKLGYEAGHPVECMYKICKPTDLLPVIYS